MKPTTWHLDPAHTQVEFAVKHLMIATVRGRFGSLHGSVRMTGEDVSTAQVEASLDVASLTTGVEQRDAHLRSPDFFDAERFPTINFRSSRVREAGDGKLVLEGVLTIRDVSREVVLDVVPEGIIQDPWGGRRGGFNASGKINRSDFGMTWNQLIETGGLAVGDEVRISLEAELVLDQAKLAA